MLHRRIFLILLCIFFLGTFVRFYKLGSIPSGLQQDETSIGYNAYSILKTGKDEHGKAWPLYFKAFGEYKLPGIIYASVLPVKYFGLHAFGVRFISAFSGSLTILLFFAITRELFSQHKSKDTVALLSAGLIALNPWHLHFSRGAFEVTLALFFLSGGFLAFLIALKRKSFLLLVVTAASFIASLYTYNISRLFVPLLGITLFVLYRQQLLKFPKKLILTVIAFSLLLLFPFIKNMAGKGGVQSATGTLIFTSKAVHAPLIETRGVINLGAPLIAKALFNLPFLTSWQYIQNIASYMSVEYMFLTGSIHGNHGIGTDGQFYLFQLPLLIIGIVLLSKKPKQPAWVLIVWALGIIGIASLTREAPQATRSFNLIFPVTLVSALGLEWVLSKINQQQKMKRIVFALATLMFILYSLAHYLFSYFYRFPIAYALQWNQADKELVEYINANKEQYMHIIFDKRMPFPYTSLLFYLQYSPATFQDNVVRAPDDREGFSRVTSFEKYQFTNVDWGNLIRNKAAKSLIVVPYQFVPNPEEVPFTYIKTIYYPSMPRVLSKDEQLFFFSEKKEAYVLLTVD